MAGKLRRSATTGNISRGAGNLPARGCRGQCGQQIAILFANVVKCSTCTNQGAGHCRKDTAISMSGTVFASRTVEQAASCVYVGIFGSIKAESYSDCAVHGGCVEKECECSDRIKVEVTTNGTSGTENRATAINAEDAGTSFEFICGFGGLTSPPPINEALFANICRGGFGNPYDWSGDELFGTSLANQNVCGVSTASGSGGTAVVAEVPE